MRKRILSIVLTLCMVLMFVPQTVFADTTADGNFEYSVSDGRVTITKYTGSATEVTIPSTINGNPVTAIGSNSFRNKTTITSITIPDSVTSIGIRAFSGCTGLTSITIPNSVTTIGEYAFWECTGLTSITIPDGVTSIGTEAFRRCTSLTSITIPNSVTSIGISAFSGCTGLTSVTIPDGVTSIGAYAFNSCTSLTSITIPDSVTFVGEKAFQDTQWLIAKRDENPLVVVNGILIDGVKARGPVSITNDITTIGESAFRGSNITSITIPDSVTTIGVGAFLQCMSLTSVTIPNSVTSIGYATFQSCVKLTSVTIPDSVSSIGGYAFNSCASLTSLFLPDDLDVSSAKIPADTTQVKYSLDTEGKVTITGIALGTGKTGVAIPATICGYPVVAVADNYQGLVGTHTCVGGEATCQSKATCGICGNEYGEIDSTNHNLEKISAKDATVTETGSKEYWHCKDCDKYFSDENGKSEIIDLAAWKAGEGKLAKLPPEIINGKGMSIAAGEKKELTFRSNADFSDFIRVELDGKTLDAKYYTAKEGSTIITLKADYVASLSAGDHTIGIVSTSGTATTNFTVDAKAAPKTGDNSNLLLWLALLFVSGGMMTVTGGYRKREKHS